MARLFGLSMAACAALCAAMPAYAHGSARNDPLRIEVTATVVERCGLSAAGGRTSASGDLQSAQSLRLEFDVDCNTPFRIGVSSTNGALRLATASSQNGSLDNQGFSIEKDYEVALQVATDDGLLDGGSCRSRTLVGRSGNCPFYGRRAGDGLSSGRDMAIGRSGTLTVSWREGDEGGPRRAAGRYQDFLTVVIGPRT
jgi:hypothetical protein